MYNRSAWGLLLLAVLLLGGCGSANGFFGGQYSAIKDYFWGQEPETAREMLQAGEEAFQDEDYREAIKQFRRIKERFPFSPQAAQAEIRLADSYFEAGQYEGAIQAYKEFESLHPGHERLPYVLYRIGQANLRQFKSIDLPQDNVREARQYFSRLEQSFPGSEYADQAREKREQCERHLAQHEIFVADFYWRTKRYLPAWKRYQNVLQDFPEQQEIRDYARERSSLAYYRYMQEQAEEMRVQDEGSWKEWFDWL
ncbi:MAG: outer membrane protein assembly factor BamD [Desulfohalobiaceae bacterium]